MVRGNGEPSTWYDELFTRIGNRYDRVFANEVLHTEEQVDFLMQVLALRRGQRVLDVGCGPGRHAIVLARRGMRVTAVDRHAGMLALATGRARAASVQVDWVHADARRLPGQATFAAGYCLFASWGYAEDPEDDVAVMAAVASRLQPGAAFLLDVPNAEWLQAHPAGHAYSAAAGVAVRESRRFDPEARALRVSWRVRQTKGPAWSTTLTYRVYRMADLEWLLARCGLVLEKAYGDFTGAALGADCPRCLAVARRPVLPALGEGASPAARRK